MVTPDNTRYMFYVSLCAAERECRYVTQDLLLNAIQYTMHTSKFELFSYQEPSPKLLQTFSKWDQPSSESSQQQQR